MIWNQRTVCVISDNHDTSLVLCVSSRISISALYSSMGGDCWIHIAEKNHTDTYCWLVREWSLFTARVGLLGGGGNDFSARKWGGAKFTVQTFWEGQNLRVQTFAGTEM